MCRIILCIAVFVLGRIQFSAGIGNSPVDGTWEAYKEFHGKSYDSPQEESIALTHFSDNAQACDDHNRRFEAGEISYGVEMNEYADQHPDIFSSIRNGLQVPLNFNASARRAKVSKIIGPLSYPASLDWRNSGKVSPVKNQGQCGSCWAFSSTGGLESQQLMTGHALHTLSEEQLVDCDPFDSGCGGGFYGNAWYYLMSVGGSESDGTYPYTAGDYVDCHCTCNPSGSCTCNTAGKCNCMCGPGVPSCSCSCSCSPLGGGTCKFQPNQVVQGVAGYYSVAGNAPTIMQTLSTVGPLSIGVDASLFHLYSTGIISCTTRNINHAILLVGYGTDGNGNDYWIVKNSWGTGWGDAGFAHVSRTVANDCGLSDWVYYAVIQ